MKNQALFSSKDKSKKSKCCLLQFLFGALRVNTHLGDVHVLVLYPGTVANKHYQTNNKYSYPSCYVAL